MHLERSLHFSSEHYTDANEGGIHSGLSFVRGTRRGRRRRLMLGEKDKDVNGEKRDGVYMGIKVE